MYAVQSLETFMREHPRVFTPDRVEQIITRAREAAPQGVFVSGALETIMGDVSLARFYQSAVENDVSHIASSLAAMSAAFGSARVGTSSALQIASVRDVLCAFPGLAWKAKRVDDGAAAYATLTGSKELGGFLVLAALERCSAPLHVHLGEPYGEGELIMTLAGELYDTKDNSEERVVLTPGITIAHAGGSKHEPYAPNFWFGLYRQNRGSRAL